MGYEVQKVNAKPLQDLMRLSGQSPNILADALGISVSALHTYNRSGKMPAYLAPACRAVAAEIKGQSYRTGEGDGAAERLIVVLPAGEKAETIRRLLADLGAKYRALDDI